MKKFLEKGMRTIALVMTICMCTVSLSFAAEVPEGSATETEEILIEESVTETEETEKELTDLKEKGYEVQVVNGEEYVYTGEEIKPEIQVVYTDEEEQTKVLPAKNEDGTENYTVEYKNNVNVGEAQVVVTGNEELGYTGSIESSFIICSKSLEDVDVSLDASTYTYTGKTVVPSVTVKDGEKELVLNKDYKVSATAKEVGTAYATISGWGNYSGSIKVKYTISLGTSTSFKTSPTAYNKITLSWKKVTGASGYAIYRSTSSNGKYSRVKTIKSGSTSSWVDEDRKMNTTYYYKMRAYRKVGSATKYGSYTSVIKQKAQMGTPTIHKISPESYNSIKLTWGKKSGATGYAVYRSTSENGTYSRIATIKSGSAESYTDKSCSCGVTYYYKLRAYRTSAGKNYYSNYSSVKSARTTPSKSSISKYSIVESTKVTLKWTKSAGASGYNIYRSTSSDGDYELIKTITSGSTLSWTDTGLKSGKIYYYKLRPYRTVSGKKVYATCSGFKKNKNSWRYVNGYKLFYDSNGKWVKDVEKVIGKQSSYVIKVNKQRNVVTVYAKDGKNGYIIPVKAFVCSTGYATPSGTFYTPQKYRWHELMGPSWGQWCTRIHGGVLFHSVFYNSPNNNKALSVSAYNKLGTTCSHGCVRLTAGDAKWIYDNCKLKTKVIVYSSSDAGPFGKPSAVKLPSWHRWDPTDPNMKSTCQRYGCH